MSGDDHGNDPEWPIERRRDRIETSRAPAPDARVRDEPRRSVEEQRVQTRRRSINPIFIALAAVVLLLLVLWLLLGRGNSDQDKLSDGSSQNAAAALDPEKRCASKHTYDLIKRELFRRAAQVRGRDAAVFDRLSAYAVLRMENPVMESDDSSKGLVNCTGTLSLDLPPGVAFVGGRRTLSSDVNYTIQPAADDSGDVVLLRNADTIIAPLATLARSSGDNGANLGQAAPSPPVPIPAPAPGAAAQPVEPAPPPPPARPVERPRDAKTASAHPSFDCSRARTKGEVAVCSDSSLASLDRIMSAQYVRAVSAASPQERALLRSTRDRFLAYRDRCPSRSCMTDAYNGRMREIRDIMAGSWEPR